VDEDLANPLQLVLHRQAEKAANRGYWMYFWRKSDLGVKVGREVVEINAEYCDG